MNPLQTELALPAYTGLSDQVAADKLNAPIVTGRKVVPLGDIKVLLYQDAVPCAMLRLEDATKLTPTTPEQQALLVAARTVYAWLNDPHVQTVDLDNATAMAGMAGIVRGGIITETLAAQIDAMATVTTTRAKQLGCKRTVTAQMVAQERARK